MKYAPAAIADIDIPSAETPELGGESKAYVSFEPWRLIADIKQPVADSGVATMNQAFDLPVGGHDLQMVSVNGARSAVELVMTLGVTFADNSTGTATATFAIPARSKNQSFWIPQGIAVDVMGVGAGAGKKIKYVNPTLTSVVGGDTNNIFMLVALPEEATYSLIGCVRNKNAVLPIPKSKSIACGMNGSAFVKTARSEPGTLTISQAYVDYMDGLARINGHFVTVRIDTLKDERLLTERTVVARFKGMSSPNRGDGDDEVEASAEGNFQEFAVFVAP